MLHSKSGPRSHQQKKFSKRSHRAKTPRWKKPPNDASRSKGATKKKRDLPTILEKVSKEHADFIILDYLDALGSPRALTVWLLYKYGEHRALVELLSDPLQYNDPEKFRIDHAATKFLSKCVGLKTGIDLKAKALSSAEEAERICLQTNRRLLDLKQSPGVNPGLNAKLFRAQQIIATILGPLPESFRDTGWSKGRTSAVWGERVASIYKYSTSQPDVTVSARSSAMELMRGSPMWGASALNADGPVSVLQSAFTIASGNTMITVPKSAKTDRVICYEPHMNIRLQLAVGSYIRSRLSKRGIDLNDQSVNQRRAQVGSLTGELATIDLSMASDTVSLELVYELLPVDWAVRLDQLRSRYTLWPDGTLRKNEKFSSMGNGFTFELESLIFYALASTVTSNVSVYGDDIIVPSKAFTEVSDLLNDCGFSLNLSKSYATTYFRESCGCDSFSGVLVSPVYLRRLPKTREDVVKFHNAVRQWCDEAHKAPPHFQVMLRKWRDIHTCHLGPSGYGDGHYHVDFDTMSPSRAEDGIDGWWFKTWIRSYRVNTLYGDRVSGRFSDEFAWGALCTALGPKQVRSAMDASVDRRQGFFKQHRALASFTWPTIVWGS